MDYESKNYMYLRGLVFLIIFLILHYLYEWFPNIITQIFSGTDESLYQHLKIGFYDYLILTTSPLAKPEPVLGIALHALPPGISSVI